MKRIIVMGLLAVLFSTTFNACGTIADTNQMNETQDLPSSSSKSKSNEDLAGINDSFTVDTAISDVISDPVFEDYGRLIFPVNTGYYSGDTLGDLQLTWYNNIDPDKTVEIANYMKDRAKAGDTIFYDIYTEEEKAADPAKEDTGYDPPTYACVGENDGIANWHSMENRINNLKSLGIDTEFHVYPGLSHGFGLGTGTAAEGWLKDAVAFWEKQM